MRKILITLIIAVCSIMPVMADYYDPYISTMVGLEAEGSSDYAFTAYDYTLSLDATLRAGGFITPDIVLYGIGSMNFPFHSDVLFSNFYGHEAVQGPSSWSLGFGAAFQLEDKWSIGVEGMIDFLQGDKMTVGGTLRALPAMVIAPAREWFAASLIIPVSISFTQSRVGLGIGIGLSIDINDHAIN